MTNLTTDNLRRALAIREKIDALELELTQLVGAAPSFRKGRGRGPGRPKGKVAAESPAEIKGVRRRRKMSAAAKARIAAAARKRWKLAKAAGKRTLGG